MYVQRGGLGLNQNFVMGEGVPLCTEYNQAWLLLFSYTCKVIQSPITRNTEGKPWNTSMLEQ